MRFEYCQNEINENDMNYNTKYITVHCSATKEGINITAADIDRWHKSKGWSGIGYHYVVRIDGKVEVGRPINKVGAHVYRHNRNNIGVCYIGGVGSQNEPKDTRTFAQKESLVKLLKELKRKHPNAIIQGHRDFSPDLNKNGIIEPFEFTKACPCFDAKKEYEHI
jgi:N-acetylmuramoyl-L-alanine amidase